MSAAYHITLSHPGAALQTGTLDTVGRFTNSAADAIIALHCLHTDMYEKFTADELRELWYANYIDAALDLDDLRDQSLLGLHMAQFWLDWHKGRGAPPEWPRWYAQVARNRDGCWQLHLVLAVADTTEDSDADPDGAVARFVETVWRAYKEYFRSSWLPEGAAETRLYGDREFEDHKAQLLHRAKGDFEALVEGRLSRLPALGAVYRSTAQHGQCTLCCYTNDPRYEAPASRLWLPETKRTGRDLEMLCV